MNTENSIPKKNHYLARLLYILLVISVVIMIGLSTYVLVLGHLKVGLFALSFALIILAIMVYLAFVIKRVELLLTLLSRGYEDNKIKNSFFYSKGTLALITNYYLQHSRESLLEDKRRHAEYLVLQNQINPHFLYNTLEAIRSEALIGGLPQVADMSETLEIGRASCRERV